ncbi:MULTISPECIES: catalase family peroxidase [unclassified Methylibium]|uniref:catalase family peroxidase n=1 Tax=unclassified Methylibium TaxID=2633235 RepID=UPI0003F3EBFC|nr:MULTISPECIES: catalase family peroxidase [unclassified Methylibium]EWS55385.1 Catalase [Methylibium sp. T29]EWS59585.1 Catalase [Methylibium sp. T29-B]
MTKLVPSAVATASALLAATAFAQSPAAAPVDPNTFLNQFESTFGKFEGFRRSGAKGICATGEFVGSAEARALSTASAFSGNPVPVVARFSVGGANPKAPDNAKSQRNLALQFNLPNGEQWQMGNISAPVFGASSPQQFFGRLASLQPDPVTKTPDAAKVKAFADANPEVLLQGKYFASQPVPASFGTVNYWGVHAFGFVNASGTRQFGKWIFEPVGGLQGLTDEEAKAKGPAFLFDDLRQRVKDGKVAFNFNLELAQADDKIDSATVPLPEGRKKVNLGLLKITSVAEDSGGECLTITYNPMVLPKGVEPSGDPMLAARAAPYAVGLGRRLTEGAKQQ